MSILPKMKVYVQLLAPGCYPKVSSNGDLIDLRAAEAVNIEGPKIINKEGQEGEVVISSKMVPLGVRMLLPKGTRANLAVRSGTYKNFKVILANSIGMIDNSFNGPDDQWKANLIALGKCHINGPRPAYESDYKDSSLTIFDGWVQGDRICQFEVVLSQKATVWQKLSYLFHHGVELVYVKNIDTVVNRGGFNKSGVQ